MRHAVFIAVGLLVAIVIDLGCGVTNPVVAFALGFGLVGTAMLLDRLTTIPLTPPPT